MDSDERATDERTIDELIELADEIPDRLGLAEGMADLRGRAAGEGVSLAVDVQGKLVELEIGDRGLALGPERLAAEISRLAAEASTEVLHAGLRAAQAGSTPQIAGAIAGFLGLDVQQAPSVDEPRRPSRPAREDDESDEGFVLKPLD